MIVSCSRIILPIYELFSGPVYTTLNLINIIYCTLKEFLFFIFYFIVTLVVINLLVIL